MDDNTYNIILAGIIMLFVTGLFLAGAQYLSITGFGLIALYKGKID
jgi:hypothetical protein